MSDTTPKIDLSNLKAGGFIKERGKDFFTVRLRVPGVLALTKMPPNPIKVVAVA